MCAKPCPRFIYDANGQLMVLEGPKRMVYIGGIYEKDLATQEITKYYFAEGRRVAMRKGSTLRYLASDHLGSTAFVMNATGTLESHVRYYPYGMTWSQSATPATDRLFTGHQQMGAKSGTYYANARFYSADIGRFPQPDSILPDVYEPQALSRYTYVANNPTNYTDPTGHFFFDGALGCGLTGGCGGSGKGLRPPPPVNDDSVPVPKPGGGGENPSVPRWPFRWLPLPANPALPVSNASACAPRVACCWMGGEQYLCGTWGSDPSGSGGGLLRFLRNISRDVLGVVMSDCFLAAISFSGLILIGVATGGTAIYAVSSGYLVTTSVSATLTSATAIGYMASGNAGGTPYEVADLTFNFVDGAITRTAGCID